MSAALQQPLTAEEFLAWATTQEGRFEFDGAQPVAMAADTANHDRITHNIALALRAAAWLAVLQFRPHDEHPHGWRQDPQPRCPGQLHGVPWH